MSWHQRAIGLVVATLAEGVALAQSVDRFGLYEASFQHNGTYTNLYRDLTDAVAMLTAPGGEIFEAVLFWG